MSAPRLEQALRGWREALGPAHVLTDEAALRRAATATFETKQKVAAVLRPADVEQVRACVRAANACRVPLYPVSSGLNWGYGSRVPPQDGCAVMELSRLDRILAHDEELAYVTVEPGVTIESLAAFLRAKGSRLAAPATGGPPGSSLIGHALERGTAAGPGADRFLQICDLEVVLPDGELLRTGFGRFEGAKAGPVSRADVGPYLDGLFSQSSLGIVTRMTLWLAPRPACFQILDGRLDGEEGFEALVDALRGLRQEGTLPYKFTLADACHRLLPLERHPDAGGKAQPLSADALRALRERRRAGPEHDRVGAWSLTASVGSATRLQAWAARRRLRAVLAPRLDGLAFRDDAAVPASLRGLYRLAAGAEPVAALTSQDAGLVTTEPLRMVYWRKPVTPPPEINPDRDRCGLVWIALAVPFTGADARGACGVLRRVLPAHGFDAPVKLHFLTERVIRVMAPILYDRNTAGEDERAAACHGQALRELGELGYFPYRLTVQSMGWLPPSLGAHDRVLGALKAALDPAGILSPGRYGP